MALNLAGLGIIYNNYAGMNQQMFQLNAVPGTLSVVVVDGRIQDPNTYIINRSLLIFNAPLVGGEWVYVLSGQGGTFIPQSYVDNALATKADALSVVNLLAAKADKSGTAFTGEVTVPEPVNPMNPVTLQRFNSLPTDIATITYVNGQTVEKATVDQLNTAVANLIPLSQKGASGGIAALDVNGDLENYQIPSHLLTKEKDLHTPHAGTLAVGTANTTAWKTRNAGFVKALQVWTETAPVGADIIVDILKNGTTIFALTTDRLIIPAGQHFTEKNITSVTFVKGDLFRFNVIQVGTTTAGGQLNVTFEYEITP